MKIKHNKFRNTGLIYELLVKQITADTLAGKESPAVKILRKFYTGSSFLVKEFNLYDYILKNKGISQNKAESILSSIVDISRKLDQSSLRNQKYELVKEIKKHYSVEEFFSIKVRDYKPLAALYCLLEAQNNSELVDPNIFVNNKVTILEHLTSNEQDIEEVKDTLIEDYSKYDKDLKLLTYKLLLEKFNTKYDNLLLEQKNVLREFITSINSTVKLRNTVNERIEDIRIAITAATAKVGNEVVKIKLNEVLKGIQPLSNKERVDDNVLINLMQYYELIDELRKLWKRVSSKN